MKIAILGTRGLPAQYGGFETLANYLSLGLAAGGHQILVYGRTRSLRSKKSQVASNVWSVLTPTIFVASLETLVAGWTSALRVSLIDKPDVVLFCNPGNVWAAKFIQFLGIPVVLHLAGLEHTREKWAGLGGLVLRRAIQVAAKSRLTLLCDSEAVRDWYRENLKIIPHVIKYGADPVDSVSIEILPFDLKSKDYDLVVARWEPDTQVAEVINAHNRADTGRMLVVLGKSPSGSRYLNSISEAISRHPKCLAPGEIWNKAQLDAIWHNSYCYIHGHRTGGTNPALLTGSVSGAEVLAHANEFNAEVIKGNAWLWANSEQLTLLLRNAPWRENPKAKNLVASTLTSYKWSEIVSNYERLFEQTCLQNSGQNSTF